MAPMIAPKGTCVSWKGGKVEYSPVPKEEEFIIPSSIKRLHCDYSWKINEYKIEIDLEMFLQDFIYRLNTYFLNLIFDSTDSKKTSLIFNSRYLMESM